MNDSFKEIIQIFIGSRKHQLFLVLFLLLGLTTIFLRKPASTPEENRSTSADTYIPEGMVLIPIEIQNKEALSNIMGDFGIVDLYSPSFGDQIKSKKVAAGIKIMRAPLNHEVYAVLVKEESASTITEFPGPFIVTIQNPKTSKSKIYKDKLPKRKLEILSEI